LLLDMSAILTAAIVIVAIGLVILLSILIAKSLRRLTDSLNKMAAKLADFKKTQRGGAMATITETEHKRVMELGRAYRKLQEMQAMLVQAEKLNAVGQLASGVAHEVRNPLGIILQGVNYLEQAIPSKKTDVRETLVTIKQSVKRADKIISALFDFSKATRLELHQEELNSILENSLVLVKTELELNNVKIVKEMKPNLPKLQVDKTRLEQVFVNIFLNAIQAMPEGGQIFIRSFEKELREQKNGIGKRKDDYFRQGEKAVMVEIEDTGAGIAEEDLKRAFDPFFTTKGPRKGTGLGLAVSQSIINMHRGLIDITSQVNQGTKISITLKAMRR